MPQDLNYLSDIIQAAHLIQQFVEGFEQNDFVADVMRQDAVIRRLAIIGEAVQQLSGTFKTGHPEIPWKEMAGMRNILIHNYNKVDIVRVWVTIRNDIPALIAQIEPLVPPEEDNPLTK
ncbi:MAG: DUF86 domain-containing protein [Chloroflexota bacterium]